MRVITDEKLYKQIWDRIFEVYSFYPSVNSHKQWLKPEGEYKKFKLKNVWDENQEAIINKILCDVIDEELYALDWQHDCFMFNPNEEIQRVYEFYDSERNCNVFFPEYYPNGDYHFFISKDWTFGLYGHPWRKEIIVVGHDLIEAIQDNCVKLGINPEK